MAGWTLERIGWGSTKHTSGQTLRAALPLLGGIAAGAVAMYLLDPRRGARRRGVALGKVVHARHVAAQFLGKAARDLDHRTRGVIARLGARRARQDPVSDDVLTERVRASLGRAVSHPGAVIVSAESGTVKLEGVILSHEVDRALARVERVPGVQSVDNRLETHKSGKHIPALQGGVAREGHRFELLQMNWSPAPRLLVGAGALAAGTYALHRGGVLGAVLGLGAGMLLLRDVTNKPLKRVTGIRAGRRAIDIQKTVHIDAPVEEVFAFWQTFENFPRIMSHVRDVKRAGDGRYRWTVSGPVGIPVHWDADVTLLVTNEYLGWKSVPGAAIENAGVIRFEPDDDGSTRVHIRMSYNPPAGVLGHAVASFFRVDPKHAMDDDLMRFKSLMETGKTRAHGEKVSAAELREVYEPPYPPEPSGGWNP